ncbi:MAG: hypothetical protein IPL46_15935 [Saprospiraceae bacterium]|nr:hypothetical protein [Saprospiraceae bacterium]
MKFVSFIFSILIFSLAITPCTDGETCNEDIEASAQSHDHSEDQNDACTPFCTCHCCGASISIGQVKHLMVKGDILHFAYDFHYESGYSFDHQDHIWQPPKV